MGWSPKWCAACAASGLVGWGVAYRCWAGRGDVCTAAIPAGHESAVSREKHHGGSGPAEAREGAVCPVVDAEAEARFLGRDMEVQRDVGASARMELAAIGEGSAMEAFWDALAGEDWLMAQALAASGVVSTARDGSDGGATALHLLAALPAAEARTVPEAVAEALVRSLVDAGAEVDARGRFYATGRSYSGTALHAAAAWNHTSMLQTLLEHGSDANALCVHEGGAVTPCYLAAAGGHATVLHRLLQAGADINAGASNGATPCFAAARHGDAEALRLLIDAGADINAPRDDGATPCFAAAAEGSAEALQVLADAGADIDCVLPLNGATPCYAAAEEGHADALRVLVAAGADYSTAASNGATPCTLAFRQSNYDAVQVLVEAETSPVRKRPSGSF
eukprot:TRINITY_DN16082_c0_g1_i1.p1 TRINITY_DN16082_c0_g1~~TRINITY_DN16082_c0_g1_i1.p1  ORF type:complete len:394 (+),score=87.97 TRINITY_DN16082_c0_g1_i1:28-1209(+)